MPLKYKAYLSQISLALLFLLVGCNKNQLLLKTETKEEIIYKAPIGLKIGELDIEEAELNLVLNTALKTDSTYLDSLATRYINSKRIALEATKEGINENELVKEELENYKNLIAEEYLFDEKEFLKLKKETLEHLKYEVNASHIFIKCPEFASPKDTLEAFNRINKIFTQLKNFGQFEKLATEFSEDPNTNKINGNMGWFSSLQLIYSLENAIYNTTEGRTSEIVRSPQGYHIIKVNERRPNSGTVWVKHIIKIVKNESESDSLKGVLSLVYNNLKAGQSFDSLCEQYSDDPNAKLTHGELPPFSIGTREESDFEDAAFKLREGEYSYPIRSKNNWHIIYLIKKEPFKLTDELELRVESKLKSRSREDELEKRFIAKKESEFDYSLNNTALEEAISMLSNSIKTMEWDYSSTDIKHEKLFKIGNTDIYTNQFLNNLKKNQFQYKENESLPEFGYRLFYDFKDKMLKQSSIEKLSHENSEFKSFMSLFTGEVLEKKYLEKYVIGKATEDSVANVKFFNENRSLFTGKEVADITLISYLNDQVKKEIDDLRTFDAPYALRRGIKPLQY